MLKRRTIIGLASLLILACMVELKTVFRWYCPSCYSAVTRGKYTATNTDTHTDTHVVQNMDDVGELQQGRATLNHSQVMKERANSLRQRCKELQTNGTYRRKEKFGLGHLVVNDKYKLIYCYIPKVACTNIKKVFLLLTGELKATDPSHISHSQVHVTYNGKLRTLGRYNKTEVEHRLANYKKIIFVRDPFERLLSAYKNKLVSGKQPEFQQNFGRDIVRRFRKNATQASLRSGKDVTFPEFAKYLINKRTGLNEHWATYQDMCSPCEVGYDYIGSYETLETDMNNLLNEIGVNDTIRFPKREETYDETKTRDIMSKFYKQISRDDLRKLYDAYFSDFYLFGYEQHPIV